MLVKGNIIKLKITYFKKSGKFYTEVIVNWVRKAEYNDYQIAEEIKQYLSKENPGLTTVLKNGFIVVNSEAIVPILMKV